MLFGLIRLRVSAYEQLVQTEPPSASRFAAIGLRDLPNLHAVFSRIVHRWKRMSSPIVYDEIFFYSEKLPTEAPMIYGVFVQIALRTRRNGLLTFDITSTRSPIQV